jgi:hypothetical protein
VVTRAHRTALAAVAIVALVVTATRAYSHPLHTTMSELSLASDGRTQIVLRAFVDDFSAAVTGRGAGNAPRIATPADSQIARYVSGSVILSDPAGRRITLTLAGVKRSGDLVWVTLHSATPVAPNARLTNTVLFERYDDQVNIVQTSIAGRRRTLLFTRRDGAAAKPL